MFSFWKEEVREWDGRGRSKKMCLGWHINLLCLLVTVCLLLSWRTWRSESSPPNPLHLSVFFLANLCCLWLTILILNLNPQFLPSNPSFVSVFDLGFFESLMICHDWQSSSLAVTDGVWGWSGKKGRGSGDGVGVPPPLFPCFWNLFWLWMGKRQFKS